jgi:CRP/FNR family transcriptional regulator, cyclic AMP receptor protein
VTSEDRHRSLPGPRSRSASYAYLFDLDDDLAQELDLRMRAVARQVATVRVSEVVAGDWEPAEWLSGRGRGLGLLVVDGVIAMDTEVCGRVATELLGSGDLLQPVERTQEELVERRRTWKVLLTARLAHLDEDFADRVRPWPRLTQALLRRAARRATDLDLQRAIACHPRLDVRIALCLWNLAGRWGKVEPGGICLRLPLTHRLLGQLVGAERPSVSHALTRLAHAGLVTGHGDEWHLHGTVDAQLEALDRRDEHPPAAAGRKLRAVGDDD